jgi:invasion protein IalB
MKRAAMSLFAMLLLAGPAAGPALPQNSTATPDSLRETYGSWVLSCGAGRTGCHVFQALYRGADKARLVQVTVFAPTEDSGTPLLRALVPLGATIAAGAAVAVDGGTPETVPFRACWPRGCVAELALTSDLEMQLRIGEILSVAVQGADTGRTLRFELALEGISAALNRLAGL